MPKEIERKFLLKNDSWRGQAVSHRLLRQGYAGFAQDPRLTLRIRQTGHQAFLTLKGPSAGCSRSEFEYQIPSEDAAAILKEFCGSGLVEKKRWRVPCGVHVWEVDEFLGDNAGLVVAEIELDSPDAPFEIPDWLGREVTGEVRFYNARLADCPYCKWTEDERK